MRLRLLSALLLPLLVSAPACKGNRDSLLAQLQSPQPEERAKAVARLARHGRPEDLVLFTQAAKDVSAVVRAEAAGALATSQDARVVDLLGELLEDPDERVQSQAALALAQVKDGKARTYLTQQYARRGAATRRAILQALKESGVEGALAEVVAAESDALWVSHLRALQGGTLPERVGAAEALGRSGRPEAVTLLRPLVRDSQVVLASAAVRGLGEAGDRGAVAPVAALLAENFPELREAASVALGRLGDAAALPALLPVATERSPAAAAAARAVLALPRTPETDAALCTLALTAARTEAVAAGRALQTRGAGCALEALGEQLARGRDVPAALQAVGALGPLARPLLPRVLPLLESPDTGLRLAALEAVAAVGEPTSGPAVQKAAEAELAALAPLRADWVKPAAGKAGGTPAAAGAPGAGAPTEVIDDVPAERLRLPAAALRALGAVQAPGARDLLLRHAADPSAELRTAARVGLASLGPPGVEAAARGLREGELADRVAVALALAHRGPEGRRAVAEAAAQLPTERPELLEVLSETGVPPDAAPLLVPLLEQGGMDAARAAALLGDAGASDAVPALRQALEGAAQGARRALVRALGQLGDAEVAPLLARELSHDLPQVRAAAAEGLGRVGTEAERDALTALQKDYYRQVREAVAAALVRLDARVASAQGAR
jgi:HEAT repeat protein